MTEMIELRSWSGEIFAGLNIHNGLTANRKPVYG